MLSALWCVPEAAQRHGKGSHIAVTMPNGNTFPVPAGNIRVGTLSGIVKQAGLTMPDFLTFL
jgi:hypothetical protein